MVDDSISIPPEHPQLGGEARPGLYGFEDETGKTLMGGVAIIPLLEKLNDGKRRFIGTGFFITTCGVFLTAKHVLDNFPKNNPPVETWQLIPPNTWLLRPVEQITAHPKSDLAIGVASKFIDGRFWEFLVHPKLSLTTQIQQVGDLIATYAYPSTIIERNNDSQILSFDPQFYEGTVKEHHPHGRDKMMLPGPCYRTSMIIHHGASGGPVAGRDGTVFGVNSTGFNGTEESYVSKIDGILDLTVTVNNVETTINQLVDEGLVQIDS